MDKTLLLDTDVLVDYLRAYPAALRFMKSLDGPLAMSAITVTELFAVVREGREKEILDGFIEAFKIFPVTELVARQGGLWRRDFGKSHGVGLADAMIAATAQESGATLVTLNRRHFPMLADVQVPYSKS